MSTLSSICLRADQLDSILTSPALHHSAEMLIIPDIIHSEVIDESVQSCRRDLLDHVIPLNKRHLMRLLSDYVRYYHEDRTHLGLGKETPFGRPHSDGSGLVLSRARLGGLHHRYDRVA